MFFLMFFSPGVVGGVPVKCKCSGFPGGLGDRGIFPPSRPFPCSFFHHLPKGPQSFLWVCCAGQPISRKPSTWVSWVTLGKSLLGPQFPLGTRGRKHQGGEQSSLDNLKVPFGFDGLFWAGSVVPPGMTVLLEAVFGPPKDKGIWSVWGEGGREP